MTGNLVGGTFVVLPKGDSTQISCSIIEGSQKDNIRLRETSMLEWNQEGQAGYDTLKMYVSHVAQRVTDLQTTDGPVHVTCGVAETVDYLHVIENQFPQTGGVISDSGYMMGLLQMYQNPFNRDFILDQAGRQDDKFPLVFERDMIATVILDMFKDSGGAGMYVDKRSFSAGVKQREETGVSDDEILEVYHRGLGVTEVGLLKKTLPNLIGTGGIIPPRVIRAVELLGQRFGRNLVNRFIVQEGGDKIIQRFISAFHRDDIINIIFADPFLKKIFARELIKAANIDHNICLKGQQEKKSPPFADVVATFLADKMDIRDGTSPTAVAVNYGE